MQRKATLGGGPGPINIPRAYASLAMANPRTTAELFARHLKAKYGSRIERILLFGSVARRENREGSDIDLLVVTPEHSLDLQWDLGGDVTEVLTREGVLVSALVVTAKEWQKARDTFFGRRVQAEGLALA